MAGLKRFWRRRRHGLAVLAVFCAAMALSGGWT